MTLEEAVRRVELCRNFLANNYSDMGEPNFTAFNMAIEALEREPKEGHWIDTGSGQECSKCHEIQYGYDNHRFYCSNCGADMRGDEE